MNKSCLTGRVTKNIELRYTASGVPVTNFTIAVNRKFKNQNGEYESDFISCVAFKSTAELLSQWVGKGDLIGVEGRIQTRNYKDRNDKTVYLTEIMVESVDFLQSKGNSTSGEEKSQNKPKSGHKSDNLYKEFGDSIEIEDSDLPF